MANLFANLPEPASEELFETLAGAGDVRIERIVSQGHCSPPGFWYDQPQHEFVTLLQGTAQLEFAGGRVIDLVPGDHLVIAAGDRHRVTATSVEPLAVWLAVHYSGTP